MAESMFDDLGDELPPGYSIGALRADEIPTLWSWVDAEGWNPGVHDLGAAFAVDPDAFVALRHDDALVGTGSVYSYDGAFGFMGLFVLLPEHRGQGVGGILWRHRHRLVHERLSPGATCGMDGVLPMVPFYERGGFVIAYEDVRWSGAAQGQPDPAAVDLSSVPFEQVDRYDRTRAAAPRTAFLRRWLAIEGALGAAVVDDGNSGNGGLQGYGLLRPASDGWRFGPFHADDPATAERIASTLLARIDGQPVHLDVPTPNTAAVALAERQGLTPGFVCARMYDGPPPDAPVNRCFGVTSLEFG